MVLLTWSCLLSLWLFCLVVLLHYWLLFRFELFDLVRFWSCCLLLALLWFCRLIWFGCLLIWVYLGINVEVGLVVGGFVERLFGFDCAVVLVLVLLLFV